MPIDDGNIRLFPPGKNVCPICATKHRKDDPHDIMSLYYQYVFYRNSGRFPSWRDALEHCPEDIKQRWTRALTAQGIDLDKTAIEAKKDD